MNRTPIRLKAVISLITSLLALLIILFSSAEAIFKIIALSIGGTAYTIMAVIYYIDRKGNRHGK